MQKRKFALLIIMLSVFMAGSAQITSFIGASIYPNIAKTRTRDASFETGYGAGFTYVFWENKDWFIKTGVDYLSRNSNYVDLPRYFTVPSGSELVRTEMLYNQQDIIVPISIYYLPFQNKENAMIVMGGINLIYTLQVKYQHDIYGIHIISGGDIDQHIKTGFTFGTGYQRKFSDILFLNVLPTLSLDIRSDKPFTAFGLTLEMIYGVY